LYSTGLQPKYSTQTQFGETVATATSPSIFIGDLSILPGKNYLWFAVDVAETAVNDHTIDAGLLALTINGHTIVPAQASPDGGRVVSSFNGNSFTNFMPASMVIGQPNFFTQDLTIDQDGGYKANGVATSSKGMLALVTQRTGSTGAEGGRVLLWNSIPETDGAPADIVIGQPDFTSSNEAGCISSSFSWLMGAAFSPDGSKLLVADAGNNRVLVFNAPFTNGMAASIVIGQSDFVTNTSGCTAHKLNVPYSVFVHTDGRLFITDGGNNRILIYNQIPSANGAAADLVVGQVDFTSNVAGCSQTNLQSPSNCTVASDDRLIVCDAGNGGLPSNSRILVFNSIPTTNGASADVVIGKADFTTQANSIAVSDSTMFYPFGVSVSPNGKLAVGDFGSSRVLIYNTIPTSNNAHADIVLGQPDFTSNLQFNGGISDRSMSRPYNVAYDLNGRLFVAGRDMHRIMVYGEKPAQSADLQLSMSINDALFPSDSVVIYNIQMKNAGPYRADNIVASVTLPHQFTLQSFGPAGSYNSNTGRWSIPSMESGDIFDLQISGKLEPNNDGATIRATANILVSDKDDPVMENNSCFADFVASIVWTGISSNDWNDAANWNTNLVPRSYQSARIPGNPTGSYFPELFSSADTIHSILVESGAYISIPQDSALYVTGNLISKSNSTTGKGIIALQGVEPQNLEGKYSSIAIFNASNVQLTGKTEIEDVLIQERGNLILGDFDLAMGDTASFGAKRREVPSKALEKIPLIQPHVVTNGLGRITQKVGMDEKIFPVGTATSFSPIVIANQGTEDYYSVRVFPDVLENGLTGSQVSDIDHFIKNSWVVEEEVEGGSQLSVSLLWPYRIQSNFNTTLCGIGLNTGAEWDKPTLGQANEGKIGIGLVRTDVTSAGVFAIGDDTSRLALATPPVLFADNTENDPLHAITITYESNLDWTHAVNVIRINGAPVDSYSSDSQSITIPASNFPVGDTDYQIEISSPGYTLASVTQHISKLDQQIHFGPIAGVSVNNPYTLTAQATSGLPIEYVCLNTSIATVEGDILNPTGTGTTFILASQKGNDVYRAAVPVQQEFSSYALGQSITFASIDAKTYGDSSFTVTAEGGASGNPIVFTSSDHTVATCSGTNGETITIVGAGSCTIIASQEGTATYSPAREENVLVVNTKTLTIDGLSVEDKVYDGTTTATFQVGNLVGVVDGDDVTLTVDGRFTDPNAGMNKSVKAKAMLSGASIANYSLQSIGGITGNILKANPEIIWATPNDIMVGTPLSSTQLNAEANVGGTFVYNPEAGAVLTGGDNQELTVQFTPTDITNYNTASKTVLINVKKFTPVITWANPDNIVVGTALSETQLNATADVDGTFTYTPNQGTVLSIGDNQEIRVDFTPTDGNKYSAASKTVLINVVDATTPIITWSNPADIVYGTLLSEAQLNATANVEGSFAYTPDLGTQLNAGPNQELRVDFTPTDAVTYKSVNRTVVINVLKATPIVEWDNPADIAYGTLLSDIQLNATSDVEGNTFIYSPPAGALLNVGANQELSVQFTPNDLNNYQPASKTVHINVVKATPIITWENPVDIFVGTALTATQLNATANIDGEFTYTPSLGAVLAIGNNQELRVDFTPTDGANYSSASKTVLINVVDATTPIITWSNPADIVYGTLLSEAQLNATANVEGSFAYTPELGTQLNAGPNQELRVDFTPTDAVAYKSVSRTVAINVLKATPNVVWNNPADIVYGTLLSDIQLNATADMEGTFVYSPPSGTLLQYGYNQELTVQFTPVDNNYQRVTKTVLITVEQALPIVTWENPADIIVGTPLSSTQLNATANMAGAFYYTPDLGTVLGIGDNQELEVIFFPDDNNYSPSRKVVHINVVDATTPIITWSNPADIVYGTLLSEAQLNATANVEGSFVYTPDLGTQLNAGPNQELRVDFTPTDAVTYKAVSRTVTITVAKATPVITWENPADIIVGTALSETQLNATAGIDGDFAYTPVLGTVLSVGDNQELRVDFTPTDVANYSSTSKTVLINVVDATTPIITWSNPADIVYGTLLSEAQLNATANVEGSFVYTPDLGTQLNAGPNQELRVDFTPTDAVTYKAVSRTVTITVAKATPVITWENPADIVVGTALSSTQLCATADVEGEFSYTPEVETVLSLGDNQELKVDFIPTDAENYNLASKSVFINVVNPNGIDNIVISSVAVYPNPSRGEIKVVLNEIIGKSNITIFSLEGKPLLSSELDNSLPTVEIPFDLSSLPKGIYLLRAKSQNNAFAIRVVIY
jgi:hypothetical protein